MKKGIVAGLVVIFIIAAAAVMDGIVGYSIEEDNSNLAACADQFLNRGMRVSLPNDIELYESISIGRQKFTLAEINGQLGEICLLRGLNGRYKINGIVYGGGNFRTRIVEEGGEKYILLGGRNTVFGIGEITVSLEGREYRLEIPEKERFYVCSEVDPDLETAYFGMGSMHFYSAEGEDITARIPWN